MNLIIIFGREPFPGDFREELGKYGHNNASGWGHQQYPITPRFPRSSLRQRGHALSTRKTDSRALLLWPAQLEPMTHESVHGFCVVYFMIVAAASSHKGRREQPQRLPFGVGIYIPYIQCRICGKLQVAQ